ncbi:restriction endonuclease subunit S [Streptomyces sp. NPDC001674]|uniref:restriction endonuclease subunit S n=1 Tax=Streptomyces sp. NPDC001674 TaxID=3154394 RepID=UPI0033203590
MAKDITTPLGTVLADGWQLRPLGEMCSKIGSGATPKGGAAVYKDDGISFIRSQNVFDHRFSKAGLVFINDEAAARLSGVEVRPEDVLLNITGDGATIARCCVVSSDILPARVSQHVVIIRPRDGLIPGYLQRYLSHPRIRAYMLSHNSGGSRRALTKRQIEGFQIVVPPLAEQRAIAEVLGALDDKIAINERISNTAADLARAMMGAMWKGGRIPSLVIDTAPADRRWRRTTLGQLCSAGGGSIQTGPFGSQLHAADYVESGAPSVMPQNIGDNVIIEDGIARVSAADISRLSKYLLIDGDIVYSRRGDVKRRALVRRHEAGWLCGTGCLRVRAGNAVEPLWLSHYLGEPEVQNWIHRHAVGATMPNLNTAILGAVPVVLPPTEVRERINGDLAVLDARSMAAVHENRTIADLRDTLLPQLVSGKIRIKDAERAIEEAA